jgi:glutathione synthase/RimK-type ligase-like ATP-grasp enzyme
VPDAPNRDESSSFLYEISDVYEYAKKIKKAKEENQTKNSSLKVWSKHPSHAPLRGLKVVKDTIIRFGYRLKEIEGQEEKLSKTHIIINPFNAIANSASKFLMKKCFQKNNVKTADWVIPNTEQDIQEFTKKFKEETKYIVKSEFGSRGMGLLLFENKDELIKWFNTPFNSFRKNKYSNYLVERYYPYSREYRLHVTKDGCFYTCRKMLKEDSTERWYRNDSNSVWIIETNEMFQKPLNWKEIESQCVNALNSVGLDVGACDVRVQSARNSDGALRAAEKTDFIICEINSAPGLGEIGLEKYKTAIHNIIKNKQ